MVVHLSLLQHPSDQHVVKIPKSRDLKISHDKTLDEPRDMMYGSLTDFDLVCIHQSSIPTRERISNSLITEKKLPVAYGGFFC